MFGDNYTSVLRHTRSSSTIRNRVQVLLGQLMVRGVMMGFSKVPKRRCCCLKVQYVIVYMENFRSPAESQLQVCLYVCNSKHTPSEHTSLFIFMQSHSQCIGT